MRILAYNPSHDGAAVLLENGRLAFSLEAEKDNGYRWAPLTPTLFLRSLQCTDPPDAVALAGWWTFGPASPLTTSPLARIEAGYFEAGAAGKIEGETTLFGRRVRRSSSSHVRAHILCSYALSPFPQGQACYALVWEGVLGAFYRVSEQVEITKIGEVLSCPGPRYQLLYMLADPTFPATARNWHRDDDAGKLMALAAYGRRSAPTPVEQATLDTILSMDIQHSLAVGPTPKIALGDSPFCDRGVEAQEVKDMAWQISEAIFDRFFRFAQQRMQPGLPLLIAGGCGLNCDWNSKWRDCGLFSDVFVPPCTNDSGVAIGAGVDAWHHYTGRAKLEWDVYCGDPFIEDTHEAPDFERADLNLAEVCRLLQRGAVLGWVQGKYEIGPRALGNRSMIAAPFSEETRDRLNRIKMREGFRPIAPMCLEEDFRTHLEGTWPSPHMLYFQRVKSPQLAGITHVDGSARAQSVNEAENPKMHALLREFRKQTGFGVLCNTSLNFKGRGFVNRSSQLFALARDRGFDGVVIGDHFWKRAG